jgi:lysophospholipase L1-like esterase
MSRLVLSRKKKLLFAAITTLAVLIALELTVRGLFWIRSIGKPPPRDAVINRFHPLRYELLPGGSVAANGPRAGINRFGLRGADPALEPTRNRILCLGDSCTFGYAPDVTDEKTYPALLGSLLEHRQPGRYSVLNGGMPGFCTLDAFNLLEYKGPDLNPAIVVIMVGWNDPKLCHTLVREEIVAGPSPLESFALYQLGKILLGKFGGPLRFDAGATRAALAKLPGPSVELSDAAFARYERTLEEIVRLVRAHGGKSVLVTLPNFARAEWKGVESLTDAELERAAPHLAAGHLTPEGWYRFITRTNEIISRVARRLDVPLVDGASLRELSNFVDICHLNAAGNQALAERVSQSIETLASDAQTAGQVGTETHNRKQP